MRKRKKLCRDVGQGERNFELYKAFDDRMKKEYGYVFYPEAYAELQALCNDCFPTDEAFYEKAKDMNKTLMQLDGKDFPQAEFAYYIQRRQKRMRVILCKRSMICLSAIS